MGRPSSASGHDSVVSLGVRWATRVTSIGLEFALPPLLGGYLDRRWGLGSALTIVGALFGFLAGMIHLLAIAREDAKATPPPPRRTPPPPGPTPGGPHRNESGRSDDG